MRELLFLSGGFFIGVVGFGLVKMYLDKREENEIIEAYHESQDRGVIDIFLDAQKKMRGQK